MDKQIKLGALTATRGVADRIEEDLDFKSFVMSSLFERYVFGDWGDTCDEDKKTNDNALKFDERLLAVYIYPKDGTKIWIITEWDRSSTTVLFPEEY